MMHGCASRKNDFFMCPAWRFRPFSKPFPTVFRSPPPPGMKICPEEEKPEDEIDVGAEVGQRPTAHAACVFP